MFYLLLITLFILLLYILKFVNISSINREKITAYECGFHEFDEARKKYYIKFYLVAIIFLIFDLETILIYPISIYISQLTSLGFIIIYYFFFILSLGLALELYKSILN